MRAEHSANVSRETMDRLALFADLLIKWNTRINLVSPGTIPDLWARHIADSEQLFNLVQDRPSHWVDLGTGGGFPGLVIAILAAAQPQGPRVTMIESDQRKAAFLRTVLRETATPATVLADRIEAAPPQAADVISARALAPLNRLLPLVARHLAPGGRALLPKGVRWENERDAVKGAWTFSALVHNSRTDRNAVILEIGDLSHA